MTQVNITLNQEEVLQVLAGNREEALKYLLEKIINEIMRAESEEQLGAAKHERSDDRQDYRNGTRERCLTTRIGKITLEVPRHRSVPFHTMVFENYKRSEASLIATMVQMVIAGVSTRKVSKVVETLCGESFSKSTVSELCKRIDNDIEKFRTQPLDWVNAPFVMVDATYFKARENNKIVSKAFMVALAFKSDGSREVIGFDVYNAEDNYSWISFMDSLKKRGLNSVKLIISDAHKSIRKAIAEVYPEVAWQRCQVHFLRNILDATPPKYKEGLKTELRDMFNASDINLARKQKNEIIQDYEDVAEKAMKILDDGFEDSMTIMNLPKYVQKIMRSTNLLERLNRELKRRSDVIQIFPNSKSILRLMGAVTMEYNEKYIDCQRIYTEEKFVKIIEKATEDYKNIAANQITLLEAA